MDILEAVHTLAALAQVSRLAIYRLLVEAGPKGRAAGDISKILRIAPATLSFHLAQLSHAGLISPRREGRSIIYAADFEKMGGLMDFLTENCCAGDPAAACAPRNGAMEVSMKPRGNPVPPENRKN